MEPKVATKGDEKQRNDWMGRVSERADGRGGEGFCRSANQNAVSAKC